MNTEEGGDDLQREIAKLKGELVRVVLTEVRDRGPDEGDAAIAQDLNAQIRSTVKESIDAWFAGEGKALLSSGAETATAEFLRVRDEARAALTDLRREIQTLHSTVGTSGRTRQDDDPAQQPASEPEDHRRDRITDRAHREGGGGATTPPSPPAPSPAPPPTHPDVPDLPLGKRVSRAWADMSGLVKAVWVSAGVLFVLLAVFMILEFSGVSQFLAPTREQPRTEAQSRGAQIAEAANRADLELEGLNRILSDPLADDSAPIGDFASDAVRREALANALEAALREAGAFHDAITSPDVMRDWGSRDQIGAQRYQSAFEASAPDLRLALEAVRPAAASGGAAQGAGKAPAEKADAQSARRNASSNPTIAVVKQSAQSLREAISAAVQSFAPSPV